MVQDHAVVGPVDQVGGGERLVVGAGPARVAVGGRVQVVAAVEDGDVRVGEEARDHRALGGPGRPGRDEAEGAVCPERGRVLVGVDPECVVAVPDPPIRIVVRGERHRTADRAVHRAEGGVGPERRVAGVRVDPDPVVAVPQEHAGLGLERVAGRRRQAVDHGEGGIELGLVGAAGGHRIELTEIVDVPYVPSGLVGRLQRNSAGRQRGGLRRSVGHHHERRGGHGGEHEEGT